MQRRLTDSDVSKEDMYLHFQVGNTPYLIGIDKIQAISTELRFHEPYQLSHPHILGTNYTINGNAIVFDLRIYFGLDTVLKPKTIHIQDDNRNNFILLVDEIIDYVEVEGYNLIRQTYPITNTEKTFFKGTCIIDDDIVLVISDQSLLTYLSTNESIVYGSDSVYRLEPEATELISDHILDSAFNQFMWIGYRSRIGYPIEDILHVFRYSSASQWENVDKISTMGYEDIPLFNTCKYFETISGSLENEDCSIIIMKLENKVIGLLAIGNIDIKSIESYGNLLTSNLKSIIFENKSYISDYVNMGDFIGFLVDFKSIFRDLIDWENAPEYTDLIDERDSNDYVTIDADTPIAFELSLIKSIYRYSNIDQSNVFDLLSYVNKNEKKSVKSGVKNQVCIEFHNSDCFYSTVFDIAIMKFFSDQVDPNQQTLVLNNDKTYQLISIN